MTSHREHKALSPTKSLENKFEAGFEKILCLYFFICTYGTQHSAKLLTF